MASAESSKSKLPRTAVLSQSQIARQFGVLGRASTGPTGAVTPRPSDDAPAPDRFPHEGLAAADRYQLLGEVARGGMGVLLKARDRVLGREVVLKALLEEFADHQGAEARFLREARVNSQLEHPSIVPVYDVGRFPAGRPFFAMKYIRGGQLDEVLAARVKPGQDQDRWLRTVVQVARALAYAHSKGVVHRDVKPHNVMVTDSGRARLLDWGLAKVPDEDDIAGTENGAIGFGPAGYTRFGTAIGTPGYMAPEQARGEGRRVDCRADVFGLGSLLAVILTGIAPFAHDDPAEVWRLNKTGELGPAFARVDRSGADERLVRLTKRCLSAEPEARPRTAQVVARLTAKLMT